ncbi:hypothetical protein EVAR_78382_1 [Eumeta japonica]|uniref:Uncharacterized protein n=1 Tax=Eumeta variegata TaxID=151549 RepID=A0A4C1T6D7_EUMVA|nr:hypothetical protein EVAR_78382_1 [Eumeta japonica]
MAAVTALPSARRARASFATFDGETTDEWREDRDGRGPRVRALVLLCAINNYTRTKKLESYNLFTGAGLGKKDICGRGRRGACGAGGRRPRGKNGDVIYSNCYISVGKLISFPFHRERGKKICERQMDVNAMRAPARAARPPGCNKRIRSLSWGNCIKL